MNREKLLRKREKQDKNNSLSLVLTYHPALNKVHKILKKAHRDIISSQRLNAVLPLTLRVAIQIHWKII